ncbi:hypothetical protein ACS0TY_013943 [Phlomoides rotata]
MNEKSNKTVDDSWKWRLSANGLYSTKDTNDFLLQNDQTSYINEETVKEFKLIWKSNAPPKVITHAWRLLWGRLPTKSNLCMRGILSLLDDLRCVLCGLEDETEKHYFFECCVIHGIWMECFAWLQTQMAIHPSTITNLLSFDNILPGKHGKRFVACIWLGVVWLIWKWRNTIMFKNENFSAPKFIEELKARL